MMFHILKSAREYLSIISSGLLLAMFVIIRTFVLEDLFSAPAFWLTTPYSMFLSNLFYAIKKSVSFTEQTLQTTN